jgi:hypothetical protein
MSEVKKLNYVDYFKVFKNFNTNTVVISVGERHDINTSCKTLLPTGNIKLYEINNFIGDFFKNVKNKSCVKLLLELQTDSKDSRTPSQYYNHGMLNSRMFETCKRMVKKNI